MQEIGAKYTLDIDDFVSKFEKVGKTFAEFDDRLQASASRNPLAKFTTAQQGFNIALGGQVQAYQRVQAMETALVNVGKKTEAQLVDLKKRQDEFTAAGKYAEYQRQIELCEKALERLSQPIKDAGAEFDKLKGKVGKGIPVPKTGTSGSSLKSVGLDVVDELAGNVGIGLSGGTLTAGAAVAAVTATIVKATDEWAKYGQALSDVSALTGATGKGLQFLDEQAKQIEADTGIAAIEVVEAFKSIGGIKPELLENNQLLAQTTKEVIILSQASGEGLQDTAKALLGSLSQFNEGAEAAARFSNVLAAGAKLGNSEINDTSEALKVSGTAAKAAGLSFEQANGILQVLASKMIKGSEAGTAMRNVLLKLETDSDKNLRPSIVGLSAALENAAAKYDTTSERAKIFGTENIVAASQILDARKEVEKMTETLTGTSTAYEQAKTNTDNLATDLKKSGTNINAFFRNLGESQDGFLRTSIQLFNTFLTSLNSKTGAVRAAFSELFDFKTFINPVGQLGLAIKAAVVQRQTNIETDADNAAKKKLVDDAVQSVKDQTKQLQAAYVEQGKTVPAAERAAANEEKKVADQSYYEQVAAHAQLRKEAELAGRYQEGASKELIDSFSKQFEESRKRIVAATAAKKQADKQVADLAKKDKDTADALKKALGEPASDAQKKADKKALDDKNESNRLLLDAQKEYQQEAQKLEDQFGKQRLQELNKDGSEYINGVADLAQQELKILRDSTEKKLQLAKSNTTTVVNGKRQVVANTSVTLDNSAPGLAAMFAAQQKQIEDKRQRDLEVSRVRSEYKLLELSRQSYDTELQLFDKQWEEKLLIEKTNAQQFFDYQKQYEEARPQVIGTFTPQQLADFDAAWKKLIESERGNAAVYLAMVEKQKRDRNTLVVGQIMNQTNQQESASISFVNQNAFANEIKATKANALGLVNIEAEKQKAILQIQIDSAKKRLALLKEAGESENAAVISETQATIDGLEKQQKQFSSLDTSSGAGFFGSLLGLGGAELEQFKEGLSAIGNAVQQSTQAVIDASQQRIQALDAEIQAKQTQIQTEEERSKAGYANNLALATQQLNDLQAQKAREQQIQRDAIKKQEQLNLISATSDNIATTAKLTLAAANAIESATTIPFLGIFLAIAAAATLYSTIAGFKAKVGALNKMRSGGRLQGPTHEQGGIRGTGYFSDIEVEGGEHVTNARSSERYNKTLEAINKNNPEHAIAALIRESRIGLPQVVIEHIQKPGFNVPAQHGLSDRQMKELIGAVREHMGVAKEQLDVSKKHAKKTPDVTITRLNDEFYAEQEGNHKSIKKL